MYIRPVFSAVRNRYTRVFRTIASASAVGIALLTVPAHAQTWPEISLTTAITGLSFPVHLTHAGDNTGRIFVVELVGRIRTVQGGVVDPIPFLDISDRTGCSQGLLSVAFPPSFATSGRFYVNYVDKNTCQVVISRFTLSRGAITVNPQSEQKVLVVPHERLETSGAIFHSGGELAFGPDGFLYLGIGDNDTGAEPGDAAGLAQSLASLRGKIVRIDVEGGAATYNVPNSNPYVGRSDALPEIWASGLRNPWRSSFDAVTGNYYVADVGQNSWEEINVQPSGAGGRNYGWPITEGPNCHAPVTDCSTLGLTLPVGGYISERSTNNSITGGRVYRGSIYPRMQGIYFYGDFGSGNIWGLKQVSGTWTSTLLRDALTLPAATPVISRDGLVSFGTDQAGNLYVTDSRVGTIYRIVDSANPPVATNDSVTTKKNKAVVISVLANDSGGAGSLTVTGVSATTNGVASITKEGARVQFTPARNFVGNGSFTYSITDGQGGTASASVTIAVSAK